MLYATKIPFSHWPPDKAAKVQVKTRDDILEDIFACDETKAATDSNITEKTCPTTVQDTFENIKECILTIKLADSSFWGLWDQK